MIPESRDCQGKSTIWMEDPWRNPFGKGTTYGGENPIYISLQEGIYIITHKQFLGFVEYTKHLLLDWLVDIPMLAD